MNILYQFEHNFLPQWAYGAPDFFNDLINHGEKETLYRAAKNVYDKNGLEFPFKEDDFSGFHVRLDVDTVCVLLRFPEPQEVPLCYCSFIFMDANTNQIQYYTLEKGADPITNREMRFMCGWDKKLEHKQYGSYYVDETSLGDLFLIRFFYAAFHDLKGIKLPTQPKEENERTGVLKCPACKQGIIYDQTDINEGDEFLVLCRNCMRIYRLKYQNNDFLILNKIQEEKPQA